MIPTKMEKLSLLVLLLISTFAFSQDHSFTIQNDYVVWQKVFDGSSDQIFNPKLKDGQALNFEINRCKGTSSYMYFDVNFDYQIEDKEGRYRITVTNITFTDAIQHVLLKTSANPIKTDFEDYIIRNKDGEFRKGNIHQTNLKCLDDFLTKTFSPKETTILDDNW